MNAQLWVTVLSQSQMKIFLRDFETGELTYLKTVRNDLGRVRSRFLGRHDRGTVAEGGRQGSHHHTLDAGESSHDVAVDAFAKRVAKYLESEKNKDSFSSVTVIAEPKFLGRVRKSMSNEALKTVARWIPKDLEKAPTGQIEDIVHETINIERSIAAQRAD